MRTVTLTMTALLAVASQLGAQPLAEAIMVGGRSTYVTRPGDTVTAIAGRYGMSAEALAALNRLKHPDRILSGQPLTIDNSHLAVLDAQRVITINVAQRMLVVAAADGVTGYAITVGTRAWQTPVGPFTIVDKERDPVWDVPASIQREMKAQGKPVITRMEPSAENPLGAYWMRLSIPGLGIHGTNAPSRIYRYASHGCIRMHPDDIAVVFDRVTVGTTGVLIYQPIIVGVIAGRVLLEAHPDPYRRLGDARRFVSGEADRLAIGHRINWMKVDQVLATRGGRPEDVTAGGDSR